MTRVKRPLSVTYSARDRRDAARVLRTARGILMGEGDPFPVLEAARRTGVRTDSRAWALASQARDIVGGQRDERQLEAAADLVAAPWSPAEPPGARLTRVPRCRLRAPGGRCARPLGHAPACALEPPPGDLVRSVGTDHVLVGGPPTATAMVVAWETDPTGGCLRVRRDDHDRGLWIDHPSTQGHRRSGKPLLLGWPEVRRLVLDLNLELAERRDMTGTRQLPAGSRGDPRGHGKKMATP